MTKLPKKILFFLRTNLSETIAFVIAMVGSLVAFWFAQQKDLLLLSSLVLALTLYLMVIVVKRVGKDFYFIFFEDDRDIKDWIGNGSFKYYPKGKAFLIKESEAGFLYSKCFGWVDYEFSLDFKILNQYLGVIFRAADQSNYVMLQMGKNGIRPHIRANGGWIAKEAAEFGLVYDKPFNEGEWYKLTINLTSNSVNIKLSNQNNSSVFDRNWDILTGVISIPIRDKDDKEKIVGILDTHVNYAYGTLGFRNVAGEQALVKNLLIKKI